MTQYIVVTNIDTYDTSAMMYDNLDDALAWYNDFRGTKSAPILCQVLDVELSVTDMQSNKAVIVDTAC